jgi:hypothetical protein
MQDRVNYPEKLLMRGRRGGLLGSNQGSYGLLGFNIGYFNDSFA